MYEFQTQFLLRRNELRIPHMLAINNEAMTDPLIWKITIKAVYEIIVFNNPDVMYLAICLII